jgi:hypothetical protein
LVVAVRWSCRPGWFNCWVDCSWACRWLR